MTGSVWEVLVFLFVCLFLLLDTMKRFNLKIWKICINLQQNWRRPKQIILPTLPPLFNNSQSLLWVSKTKPSFRTQVSKPNCYITRNGMLPKPSVWWTSADESIVFCWLQIHHRNEEPALLTVPWLCLQVLRVSKKWIWLDHSFHFNGGRDLWDIMENLQNVHTVICSSVLEDIWNVSN